MSFPVVPCDVVLDYLASSGSTPERSTMCCVSDDLSVCAMCGILFLFRHYILDGPQMCSGYRFVLSYSSA
jgi:hypothetical protein